MSHNLNKIEKFFIQQLKNSNLLRNKLGSRLFSLLNNGDTYWHLVCKTQDKELLDIVQSMDEKNKPDVNAYNKDGVLPIHVYLSSIVHFTKSGTEAEDGFPYFKFDEDFLDNFLSQNVELNKFWLKPIYSSWKANKDKVNQNSNIQSKHRFNFPSLNIFGYPSEMLYLLYKDIFLFYELPDSVFQNNYETYEKIFHKLYISDQKDIAEKTKIEKQINPDSRHDFRAFSQISFFAVAYIAGVRDFYAVFPMLNSPTISFTIQSSNDGHTILHNLFGKIKSQITKLHQSHIDQIIRQIILNPQFKLEHLEILNYFGSSPLAVLNKEIHYVIHQFKVSKLKKDIEEHIIEIPAQSLNKSANNSNTKNEETFEEIEDTSWKM